MFDVKYLHGERNLYYNIHGSTIPGTPHTGPNMQKKPYCQKNSLLQHVTGNWMHGYDVHEALYKNWEIFGPGSGCQALWRGQYGHIVKMYQILDVYEAFYLVSEIHDPYDSGLGPVAVQI